MAERKKKEEVRRAISGSDKTADFSEHKRWVFKRLARVVFMEL